MDKLISVEGLDYPRLKVTGRDDLPVTLSMQDKVIFSGELSASATHEPAALGNGLYYFIRMSLDKASFEALQKLRLETGQGIAETALDVESQSVVLKKRGISYNKPVPPPRVYWKDQKEPLFLDREFNEGCIARVAATPALDQGSGAFSLTLGAIQLLDKA